jgi:hypothetical protein
MSFDDPTANICALIASSLIDKTGVRVLLTGIIPFLGAEHFAVARLYPEIPSSYLVVSDVPTFNLKLLPFEVLQSKTATVELAGNSTVLTVLPIDEQARLLLFATQPLTVDDRIQMLLQRAIAKMLHVYPYDIEFLTEKVLAFPPETVHSLGLRSFSFAGLNDDEVFEIPMSIFLCSGLLDELHISKYEFAKFCVGIRRLYKEVPYHNWLHASDVAQFTFSIITNAGVRNLLDPIEIFSILVAALCHDIDHDGRNNLFQRKANSIYAILASNLPPLETHHASLAINLLNLTYPKIFESWTAEDVARSEEFIVRCILATDMEKHKYFIETFQGIRTEFDKSNLAHRILLAQIIIKAADLSNAVRDFDQAIATTEKLMDEFFMQGDCESELGFEISPMCDRNSAAPTPVGQIGFYRFVAGPLFSALHAFFPELAENEQQYQFNLARWTALKESM